jgi:hypothetical protein
VVVLVVVQAEQRVVVAPDVRRGVAAAVAPGAPRAVVAAVQDALLAAAVRDARRPEAMRAARLGAEEEREWLPVAVRAAEQPVRQEAMAYLASRLVAQSANSARVAGPALRVVARQGSQAGPICFAAAECGSEQRTSR